MSHNPIFAIADRAAELRAAGVRVLSLAAGEPDTSTPDHVVAAAIRAVQDPANHRYGPAQGLPALRETVSDQLGVWSADDVLITSGAKQALFLALHAVLTEPGVVLVTSPGWPGHRAVVEAASGEVRPFTEVTSQALEAAWVPGTRAVVIANPANPSGAAVDADQWADVAAWAVRRDVWVITDDVYGGLVYDRDHVTALHAAPELRDRCVVVDSVSKAHSMTGWRVGWLAGPQEIVDRATRMLSATATHVPQVTQAAALEALRHGGAGLERTRKTYRERRDRAHQVLAGIDGVDCPLPDGGMFLFPSVAPLLERHDLTTADLATWLLENAHVAVVPGDVFEAPGRLRLCFAVADDVLDESLARLGSALRSLQPPNTRSEPGCSGTGSV